MLKDIRIFYNKTKLAKADHIQKGKAAPLEYVYIFHKEYPRFPSIKLPKNKFIGEYYQLLRKRRSDRAFSNKQVPIRVLSKILSSCEIVSTDPERKTHTSTDSEFERRTYPSAGARYPIEIYLIAFRIKGLEPGVYHFNVSKFSLELLLRAKLKKYEIEFVSPYVKNTAGVIIFTTVLSRSEIKYGLKAYPFSLIEVGHMAQNIQLSCTKYKVGSCSVGGFVNDRIADLLDLTTEELPLYTVGFGYPAH